jgi:hypothetical protein
MFQAELLLEAIDMTDNYRQLLTEYKQRNSKDAESKPVPPPMMVAFGIEDPDDFLVATIKRIRARLVSIKYLFVHLFYFIIFLYPQ